MISDPQVLYLGRWVSREHFCAFVYNSTGQRLANSYDEFSSLISSGVWFAEQKDIPTNSSYLPTDIEFEEVEEVAVTDNVVQIKVKRGRKCRSQQQL